MTCDLKPTCEAPMPPAHDAPGQPARGCTPEHAHDRRGAAGTARRYAAVLTRPSLAAGAIAAAVLLVACSSGPPVPDWQLEAQGSLRRATQAWLVGQTRVAQAEYARARQALAATADASWVARGELARCAAEVASLAWPAEGPACPAFEALRADAGDEARAYADYLQGGMATLDAARHERLPAAQRAAAAAGDATAREAAVAAITDPLSRLVAAGVALRAGLATPGLLARAVETASQQGWRRPLLAWLGLQRQRAEAAGDAGAAAALQRRIELVSAAMPVAAAASAPSPR